MTFPGSGAPMRLDVNLLDYALIAIYFVVVLGIGFAARRAITTQDDFFLAGRGLPAWVTGLAFVSANLGAIEILGMAANGAQYGAMTVHYYWVGAVPAMVFLGIVMMPFYYRSRVRSVPEFLRRRFNPSTQLLNAIMFAVAQILIAGVNLYALALVMEALLGWPLPASVLVSALIVLSYITLGGLSSAIYNEVLQFFVILAGLIPLTVLGLMRVGGIDGLADRVRQSTLGEAGLHTWADTAGDNPMQAHWIGIVFGLGFVLSFGYWTTNFAEVQRALSARNTNAARLTPIVAAYPKIFIPLVTVIPGLVALVMFDGLGQGDSAYNDAIPMLMRDLLPNGLLGIAVTGLLASFMAGMAANISGFNTVFTNDLWAAHVVKGRDDAYYVRVGRIATVVGVALGVGTAFIAAGYSNIMEYLQALFSIFNAPLFATFLLALFWKRMTAWAGFWGLLGGTLVAIASYVLYKSGTIDFGTELNASFWGAGLAFASDILISVLVTFVTAPKPVEELRGLVYGLTVDVEDDALKGDERWYRNPLFLGIGALVLSIAMYGVIL
ncbi:sodium:solute symporter family protein [Nonomuraea soli]|uniref:SSS family solute:Na+ symporter n=1 Tax=Nonomuraea soli TaxID=1032476 RepID=A0A7W0CDP8_9ACTN|nr:sodium:solute symporter family protein [Nonomuraea soli]MBA2889272.1 SSS family solute:Na+ symporter [Nonomuraea soli]